MKTFKQMVATVAATAFGAAVLFMPLTASAQQEAPDVFVKRITQEVIAIAKTDKDVQSGNSKRILDVVEEKILPNVDFQRMTSLAAGRYWREATPEQKTKLTAEFRSLLIYTYSGAISQVRDQEVEFKPLRGNPTDEEVEVRSQVVQKRGEPIQINYRLAKAGNSWKLYDVNVLGAWLVETYKGNFASEISKGGIDGLIKTLSERNQKLASSALNTKPAKP